jgi:hypothetical protein
MRLTKLFQKAPSDIKIQNIGSQLCMKFENKPCKSADTHCMLRVTLTKPGATPKGWLFCSRSEIKSKSGSDTKKDEDKKGRVLCRQLPDDFMLSRGAKFPPSKEQTTPDPALNTSGIGGLSQPQNQGQEDFSITSSSTSARSDFIDPLSWLSTLNQFAIPDSGPFGTASSSSDTSSYSTSTDNLSSSHLTSDDTDSMVVDLFQKFPTQSEHGQEPVTKKRKLPFLKTPAEENLDSIAATFQSLLDLKTVSISNWLLNSQSKLCILQDRDDYNADVYRGPHDVGAVRANILSDIRMLVRQLACASSRQTLSNDFVILQLHGNSMTYTDQELAGLRKDFTDILHAKLLGCEFLLESFDREIPGFKWSDLEKYLLGEFYQPQGLDFGGDAMLEEPYDPATPRLESFFDD